VRGRMCVCVVVVGVCCVSAPGVIAPPLNCRNESNTAHSASERERRRERERVCVRTCACESVSTPERNIASAQARESSRKRESEREPGREREREREKEKERKRKRECNESNTAKRRSCVRTWSLLWCWVCVEVGVLVFKVCVGCVW